MRSTAQSHLHFVATGRIAAEVSTAGLGRFMSDEVVTFGLSVSLDGGQVPASRGRLTGLHFDLTERKTRIEFDALITQLSRFGDDEVHEQSGGTSSIAFDYRMMAKRKGYENVRLEDLTERFKLQAAPRRQARPPLPLTKPKFIPTMPMPTPPVHQLVAPRPMAVAPKLLPISPPRIAQTSKPGLPQTQK